MLLLLIRCVKLFSAPRVAEFKQQCSYGLLFVALLELHAVLSLWVTVMSEGEGHVVVSLVHVC